MIGWSEITPLIGAQLYLAITLAVFTVGPVSYRIHNPMAFWLYIIFYHVMMISGYVIGVEFSHRTEPLTAGRDIFHRRAPILVLAVLAAWINNLNLTGGTEPLFGNILRLFSSTINIESLGALYYGSQENTEGSNKLLRIGYFTFAWAKLIIIPFIVYYWKRLQRTERILLIGVSLIPVISGISVGLNKPVMEYVIILGSSLFVVRQIREESARAHKSSVRVLVMLALVAGLGITMFGASMLGRGANTEYLNAQSPIGDIKVRYEPSLSSATTESVGNTFIWLSHYVVQGYYGFSLALDQPFTTTYGFGSSPFLLAQYKWITGTDIANRTYQAKIDPLWGESLNWHSLYSHLANDVHFLGTGCVLFALYFLLAITFIQAKQHGNIFAACVLPIFAIMIVFTPANNQAFSFIDSLSLFVLLLLVFVFYLKFRFSQRLLVSLQLKNI